MATGNFHNTNASKIFAIQTEDEFAYELAIDSCNYLLEKNGFDPEEGTDHNELRSYPSRVLGSISEGKEIAGAWVNVQVVAVARSGYYSGINLDWSCTIEVDGSEWHNEHPEIDYVAENLVYYGGHNEGLAKIQAKNIQKYINSRIHKLGRETNELFDQLADHKLGVSARFSNGEEIYHEVK